MRYLIITLLIVIISCNNNCEDYYPEEIISNNLEAQYDTARWRMYTTNFRNEYLYFGYLKASINVISCKLLLEEFDIKQDTICFRFSFFYPDSNWTGSPCCRESHNKIIFVDDLKFPFVESDGFTLTQEAFNNQKKAERDTIEIIDTLGTTFYPYWAEKKHFEGFLKITKHPLDPWLRKEAIRRGVLED